MSHRNPARAMEKSKPAICVFCGSSFGARPSYALAARTLGRLIADRGYSLVYGGGAPGLMGETARAVRGGGGDVAGVLPEFLRWIERPPEWEQNLTITPDLQFRKTRMLAMADAFVVLPGGAGHIGRILRSRQFREPWDIAQAHHRRKHGRLFRTAAGADGTYPVRGLRQACLARHL